MPIYEYACTECGPFDELRKVIDRDLPARCPECGTSAFRADTWSTIHLALQKGPSDEQGGYGLKQRGSCVCCTR